MEPYMGFIKPAMLCFVETKSDFCTCRGTLQHSWFSHSIKFSVPKETQIAWVAICTGWPFMIMNKSEHIVSLASNVARESFYFLNKLYQCLAFSTIHHEIQHFACETLWHHICSRDSRWCHQLWRANQVLGDRIPTPRDSRRSTDDQMDFLSGWLTYFVNILQEY